MATQPDKRQPPEGNRRSQNIEDSARDKERLAPEESSIELPDLKDIPGQEHIHIPPLGELADTTISSDDEEGRGFFVDDVEDETIIRMGTENDIPREDKVALENADHLDPAEIDDVRLRRAQPDNRDTDGEVLNERTDASGDDLDVPGSEEDNADEQIGEEDEENNPYSLGSDKNDNLAEGTP